MIVSAFCFQETKKHKDWYFNSLSLLSLISAKRPHDQVINIDIASNLTQSSYSVWSINRNERKYTPVCSIYTGKGTLSNIERRLFGKRNDYVKVQCFACNSK